MARMEVGVVDRVAASGDLLLIKCCGIRRTLPEASWHLTNTVCGEGVVGGDPRTPGEGHSALAAGDCLLTAALCVSARLQSLFPFPSTTSPFPSTAPTDLALPSAPPNWKFAVGLLGLIAAVLALPSFSVIVTLCPGLVTLVTSECSVHEERLTLSDVKLSGDEGMLLWESVFSGVDR